MDQPKWHTKHQTALEASGLRYMRRNFETEHLRVQVWHGAHKQNLFDDGKLRDDLSWDQLRPFCNKATTTYMPPQGPVQNPCDIASNQWIEDVCGPWHEMRGSHTRASDSCFANFVRLPEEMDVAQIKALHLELCDRIMAAMRRRAEESVEDSDIGTRELLDSCIAVFVIMKPYYTSSERAEHTVQLVRTGLGLQFSCDASRWHSEDSSEGPADVLRTTLPTAMQLMSDLVLPEESKRRRKLEDSFRHLAEQHVQTYLAKARTHGFDYGMPPSVRYWLEEALLASRKSQGMMGPEKKDLLPKRMDYRQSMDIRKVPAFSGRKRAKSCSGIGQEESGSEDG